MPEQVKTPSLFVLHADKSIVESSIVGSDDMLWDRERLPLPGPET